MVFRQICLSSLIFVTGLMSPAWAHPKASREQLARLDDRRIVDTALHLMKSLQKERLIFMPTEQGGDFIVNLGILIDYLVEGTVAHQYARSYTAREAMNHMTHVLKSKSPEDVEAVMKLIAFTIPWASDSLIFQFDTYMNDAHVPLEVRMRTLIHVLERATYELNKQTPVRRERRRIQLDDIQKRFMEGVEAEIFAGNLGELKAKIGTAAEALNAEFCEGILDRQRQLNLGPGKPKP